ncbi:hypothetical protein JL722_1518 [Aureococcus anophagefferens]|nr:hypothetical protein JL722_1518 [Aureococcus anophagefferens]
MEDITTLLEDLARDAQTTKRRAAVLARLEALAGDVEALAAGERARRARALVVVILARQRLRGCDVVEAVGGGRAGEALVDAHAFLSRDENPVVERWAAALLDATLPGAYAQHIGFDDAAPMAERVRDFSAKVNAVAEGLLREDLLRDFFAAAPPPGDAATASLLGVLANVFAFASKFQAKLRQKLARDGDVARHVALPLLRRCCAGAARGAEPAARRRHWGRLLLSLRLLVVATFKLKAARKAVCDDDPTAAVLAVVDDDAADDDDRLSGVGGCLALLVKLNVNVEGGYGPAWRATAERAARDLADRRRDRKGDDDRDGKSGSPPRSSLGSPPPRVGPSTPAASPVDWESQPRSDSRELAGALSKALLRGDAGSPASPLEPPSPAALRDAKRTAWAPREPASPASPAALSGAAAPTWTPHRVPPLRSGGAPVYPALAPAAKQPPPPDDDLCCALTGALMDEPVRVPDAARAVDKAALLDHVAEFRRWPVTGAAFDGGDVDLLPVDEALARRIAHFKFASLVATHPILAPEPRRATTRAS